MTSRCRTQLVLVLTFFLLNVVALPMESFGQTPKCNFGFEIDSNSSAFQSLTIQGQKKAGLWFSVYRAPPEVREIAKFVGRLQVCLSTKDGKPREVSRQGQTKTLSSLVINCTANLLAGNKVLTNEHCFNDLRLKLAGFDKIESAQVDFGYISPDETRRVMTYLVDIERLNADTETDALIAPILGGDANSDLGGHVLLKNTNKTVPHQSLIMIHHPSGGPQQYSAGSCQVHRRQSEVPIKSSTFRHTCESTGGSSGSMLLDSRSLIPVALHNQGGLGVDTDSFNGGHKLSAVIRRLKLDVSPLAPPQTCVEIQSAWTGLKDGDDCDSLDSFLDYFSDSSCFELNLAKRKMVIDCESRTHSCIYSPDLSRLSVKEDAFAFVRSYFIELDAGNVGNILDMFPYANRKNLTNLVRRTLYASVSRLRLESTKGDRAIVRGTAIVRSKGEREGKWAMKFHLQRQDGCFVMTSQKGSKKISE